LREHEAHETEIYLTIEHVCRARVSLYYYSINNQLRVILFCRLYLAHHHHRGKASSEQQQKNGSHSRDEWQKVNGKSVSECREKRRRSQRGTSEEQRRGRGRRRDGREISFGNAFCLTINNNNNKNNNRKQQQQHKPPPPS